MQRQLPCAPCCSSMALKAAAIEESLNQQMRVTHAQMEQLKDEKALNMLVEMSKCCQKPVAPKMSPPTTPPPMGMLAVPVTPKMSPPTTPPPMGMMAAVP
eukprot:273201-Karenia_brevis.AAC.1